MSDETAIFAMTNPNQYHNMRFFRTLLLLLMFSCFNTVLADDDISVSQIDESDAQATVKKDSAAGVSIGLNLGYSGMLNRYVIPADATGNPKHGPTASFSLDWVKESGWGLGLYFSGYFSYYDVTLGTVDVFLYHLAPQFILSQSLGQRFIITERIGVGCACLSERVSGYGNDITTGLSTNVMIEGEYCLSRRVGLAANLNLQKANFGRVGDEFGSKFKNASLGATNLSFCIGIRVHL